MQFHIHHNLLNEVYMPFYKWQFRTLRDLSWPNFYIKNNIELNFNKFEDELDCLLHLDNNQIIKDEVVLKIDNIAKIFVDRIKQEGLSNIDDLYLDIESKNLLKQIPSP